MPSTPIVVLSAAELSELIGNAVTAALANSGVARALLDKRALAQQLGCSPAHIDHLRKRGLPTIMVGQAVRFELSPVLDWLRKRKK